MMDVNLPYCKAEGINSDMPLRGADFPQVECVKKGLIVELVHVQKSGGTIPLKKFARWIKLFQLVDPPSV